MRTKLAAAVAAAAALGFVWAATASAKTIVVKPGESIQQAANGADPGDVIVVRPGVYHESVRIKQNDLTLKGAGATRDGTVLKPLHGENQCGNGGAGVCIVPRKHHGIRGTRLTGFLIRGFRDIGAIAQGARGTVLRNDAFLDDGEYGAAAFSSRGTKFLSNRATGGGEAGLYVGDSPNAGAVVRGNVAKHNGSFGIFLRDSSHGAAKGNRVSRNCLGIGLVNTGAPGNVRDWVVKRNDVRKNNRFCRGEEGGPPVSGTGIGLIGASNNTVTRNKVLRNRPAKPSAFAPGGIVLISAEPLGGTVESGNEVARNRAFHNKPDDIAWDGNGTGNTFTGNHCNASDPSGLCH
jgi:parallel beta-helix repeat protein